MKRLIVDTANILFRVAAANGKYNTTGTPEEQAGLAMHMALNKLNTYHKKFKPDEIAVTFEGGKNWRKDYTRSEQCISGKLYKGNRVKDSSMEPFFELIKAFEELVRNHSSFVCLSNPRLEGDDLFSAYVQRYTAQGDEVIGVSGDKDFVQLLKFPNFTLINPDKDKPRTLDPIAGVDAAEFFMFEKAFRGDGSDNVFTAYPRVQKKRLLKCINDDYERTKIMNETWTFTDPDTAEQKVFRVGDLFEENNLLMNLEKQPDDIRVLMNETLDTAHQSIGKFSLFHFSKFCGKFGLKQIGENSPSFANMFSLSQTNKADEKPKKKQLIEF